MSRKLIMQRIMILLAGCFVFCGGPFAHATLIVDQQFFPTITGATSQIGGVSTTPLRQEFTPTLSSIDFVRVGVKNFDTITQTVQVDIYAVDPMTHLTTGSSLGTTSFNVSPSFDSLNSGLMEANFSTPINLTPSTLYAFELNRPSQAMNFYFSNSGTYPGGVLFFGGPVLTWDLIFQEGANIIEVAIVPEPSAFLLTSLPLIGLARSRRRTA